MQSVIVRLVLGLSMFGLVPSVVAAQDYPNRPIRMIVPFPAGGGVDVPARIIGQRLGDALGTQIVVENRPGASGTIGAAAAVKSAPDGYTLLFTPNDFLTTPSLVPPVQFDPYKDLVPITMVTSSPMMVVASVGAPFSNVKELIATARGKPASINYGTPGTGTTGHISGEWLAFSAQVKLQHIPFRGGQAAANSIAAGDVPLGIITPSSAKSFVDAGKIKVIALTGKTRPSFAPPSWQTLAENGVPVDVVLWTGLFAPAGTPTAIVERLNREVAKILQDGEVRKLINDMGMDADAVSLSAFAERIRADAARYGKIIQQTGIRVER